MLEVRYVIATGEVTGWCGDPNQFGNLDRSRPEETVSILDIGVPEKGLNAYLYDEASGGLIDNPDYEPPPELLSFHPANVMHGLKARVAHIEEFLHQAYP